MRLEAIVAHSTNSEKVRAGTSTYRGSTSVLGMDGGQ
jgi:hypothetical protein